MFKNLQAGGEGTVQGTEGANAQRHEGPLDPPEKGRPGQVREVSLISAGPLSSGPQEGLDGPGYLAESVGLEEARPLVPFLGKKRTYGGGGVVEAGAFGEARGASDAPAQALPA